MTKEQILKLAGRIFSRTWEHSMIEECEDEWFYKAGESKLLKFAEAIYEKGYDEGTVDAYERQFRIQNEIRD